MKIQLSIFYSKKLNRIIKYIPVVFVLLFGCSKKPINATSECPDGVFDSYVCDINGSLYPNRNGCLSWFKDSDIIKVPYSICYNDPDLTNEEKCYDIGDYCRVGDFKRMPGVKPVKIIDGKCPYVFEYSDKTESDPVIYDPDEYVSQCSSGNLRLESTCENHSWTDESDKRTYAALNSCETVVYADENEQYRDVHIALKINKYDYELRQGIYNASKWVLCIMKYPFNDRVRFLNFQSHEGYVTSIEIDQSKAVKWKDDDKDNQLIAAIFKVTVPTSYSRYLPIVIRKKMTDNAIEAYEEKGRSCAFSIVRNYQYGYSGSDPKFGLNNYTKRELRVMCFKNQGELTNPTNNNVFKSDVRKYSHNNIFFEEHLKNTFGLQSGCKVTLNPSINKFDYSNVSLPLELIDKDGKAVIYDDGNDFKINSQNKIDRTKYSDVLDIKKKVYSIWYKRLLTYIRRSLDENNNDANKNELRFAFGKLTYEDPKFNEDAGYSALYKNLICLVAINGFSVKDANDCKITSTTLDNDFQSIINNSSPYLFGETMMGVEPLPTGLSFSPMANYIPSHYTPVCVVFGHEIKRMFPVAYQEGSTIATSLHEIAHGWSSHGSCNQQLLENDTYTAHAFYCYGNKKDEAYHCLMKPSHDDTKTWNLAWHQKQIDDMKFSEGVAYRMRDVFSCTFKLP